VSINVLIVEDSPTQAEMLSAALEDGGYQVTAARSGEEALECLATMSPDVVVSDVVMPGQVDGYELCRRIKAGPLHDTPVLLLTSLSDPMDIIRGLEAGADNFLTKPYDPNTLLERLGILLATRKARKGSRVQAGVSVYFMGREFRITSEREQILDLLITTFEDAVRQNRELRDRELELMRAKEQLARFAGTLQEQLQDIIDNSPAVVYLKDANGRYGLVNRQFERLFGVTKREALGKTDEQLLAPEMAAKLGVHDREVLESGAVREFDMQAPLGNELHTYLTVKFPLRQPTGEIYAVCGISTDITERKRAEEAVRERARQQAAVAELGRKALSTNELSDLMDEAVVLAARILQVDFSEVFELQPGAQRLVMRAGVGWAEGHLGRTAVPSGSGSQAGYTLSVGEPVIVEDYARETRFERTPLAEGSGVRSGMTVLVAGRPRPYGVLGVHTKDPRRFTEDDAHFLQAIANVLAAAIERDHSERSLSQAQRLEAVGSLAGGVAHDFNNLLTVISGSSDFALASLPADSEARADIEEISRAAIRAAGLTRQLLAFSRRQVLQPAILDVNQVVEEMGSMLRRLIRADIELTLALDPGSHMVKADPGQLEQVIVNLVVNARDAMPQGGKLLLETGLVELDEIYADQHIATRPGKYVLIAVTDTGVGMDRLTQERIFEPFFTTKGDRGTGLGLATVYGIVKQSGGSIWVYSELEHGTTFKIYLPAVLEAAAARGRELAPAIGGTETVLFVEDDDAVRQLGARMLKSAGYNVLTASSGQQALDIVDGHEGTVHLLVTDLVMPNMRGSDLAERLMSGHPDLRLLFMSGYTDPAFLEHKLIERGAPFLQKPFSAEALVRKVREVLTQPSPPSPGGPRRVSEGKGMPTVTS
jgi:two-component system cell cycle sensor histidine kinase/response regulator CckA